MDILTPDSIVSTWAAGVTSSPASFEWGPEQPRAAHEYASKVSGELIQFSASNHDVRVRNKVGDTMVLVSVMIVPVGESIKNEPVIGSGYFRSCRGYLRLDAFWPI